MKTFFKIIAFLGFVFALGCAGTSDLEMATGRVIVTDMQLYLQMAVGFFVMVFGAIASTFNFSRFKLLFPHNKIEIIKTERRLLK